MSPLEAREVPPVVIKTHGNSAYTDYGCRCAVCTQAHRLMELRRLARYREASHANKAEARAAAARRSRR